MTLKYVTNGCQFKVWRPLVVAPHLVSKYEVDIYDVPIVEGCRHAALATCSVKRLLGIMLVTLSSAQVKCSCWWWSWAEEAEWSGQAHGSVEEHAPSKQSELAKQHEYELSIFKQSWIGLWKMWRWIRIRPFKTFSWLFQNHGWKQEEKFVAITTIARDDYKVEYDVDYWGSIQLKKWATFRWTFHRC